MTEIAGGIVQTAYTFAYLSCGTEWCRSMFASGLTAQQLAEQLSSLGPKRPTDEIRVWVGDDTDRGPDGIVFRKADS